MSGASFDLILKGGHVHGMAKAGPADVGISGDRIIEIAPEIRVDAPTIDVQGCLVFGGFIETHIHLDKACILGQCGHSESLSQAIATVSALKREFTVEDVYNRGAKVIEKSIVQGTTRMRTHVEVDPRIGLRSFEAISKLRNDYAWAINLEICVFPQEGLFNDPGTDELLVQALEKGANLIGG